MQEDPDGGEGSGRESGRGTDSRLSRRCRGRVEPLSSWVTLAAAFSVNTLIAGLEVAFPLLYDPLRHKYDASRASVGIAPSLLISFGCITALVSSPFLNMFGCRPLVFIGSGLEFVGLLVCTFAPNIITFHIFYGVVTGIGYGLLYIPSQVIVQQSFKYNRGLATGISLLGFTAGTILAPVVFEYCLRTYGLSGSLLLQAAIHSHNFVFAWAYQSPREYINAELHDPGSKEHQVVDEDIDSCTKSDKVPDEKTPSPDTPTGNTKSLLEALCRNLMDCSTCRDVKFAVYVVARLGWYFARCCLSTHMVSAATLLGVELAQARYLPAVVGMANLVVRSLSTVVLNFRRMDKEVYLTLGIVCLTASCFLAASAQGYVVMLVAGILLGITEGMSTTAQPIVLVNLVGVGVFPKAMTLVELATLPAAVAGGPFSGWLVDITGDYFVTFVVAGAFSVLSIVCLTVVIIVLRLEVRRISRKHKLAVDGKELRVLTQNGTQLPT